MTGQPHRVSLEETAGGDARSGSHSLFLFGTPGAADSTTWPTPSEAFSRFTAHVIRDRPDERTAEVVSTAEFLLAQSGGNVQDALVMLSQHLDDFTARLSYRHSRISRPVLTATHPKM